MSKKSKAALDYNHVTPQMVKQVSAVLADAANHKYSVSRVYAAYNAAFSKRDQPQTCSSCLRNRVRELIKWRDGLPKQAKTGVSADVPTQPTGDDEQAIFEALERDYEYLVEYTSESGAPVEDKIKAVSTFLARHADVMTTEMRTDSEALLSRLQIQDDAPQYLDPAAPGFAAPQEGVTRHPMGDDFLPIDFTPSADDANKGTVLYADGSKVKAGTYVTAAGLEIAVQPGGKATIKHEDLT